MVAGESGYIIGIAQKVQYAGVLRFCLHREINHEYTEIKRGVMADSSKHILQ
jgi:hypothetical protein